MTGPPADDRYFMWPKMPLMNLHEPFIHILRNDRLFEVWSNAIDEKFFEFDPADAEEEWVAKYAEALFARCSPAQLQQISELTASILSAREASRCQELAHRAAVRAIPHTHGLEEKDIFCIPCTALAVDGTPGEYRGLMFRYRQGILDQAGVQFPETVTLVEKAWLAISATTSRMENSLNEVVYSVLQDEPAHRPHWLRKIWRRRGH